MARTDAFGKVPFLFGAAQALALPGPILVRLLGDLGHGEGSAKAILHRMVALGLLDLERHGRVGVYRLAGRMRDGFEAIRDDTAAPDWDGRLHTLVYEIPETRRALRDGLVAAAARFGYRMLRPGVLVGLRDTSAGLGEFLSLAAVVSGWLEVDPDASERLIAKAWSLDDLAARQRSAALRLEERHEVGAEGAAALRLLYEDTVDAYDLLAAQADLPASWLPPSWPGERLVRALGGLMSALWPAVARHVEGVVASSRHSALVVGDPSWISPPAAPA